MDFFCNNCDAIYAALISGILGAIGQALRIGIELFKLSLNKSPLVQTADLSNPGYKLGGIFIGFLVGILLTLITKTEWNSFTSIRVIAIIAAGYAVTHLIENAKTISKTKQKFAVKPTPRKANTQPLISSPLHPRSLAS